MNQFTELKQAANRLRSVMREIADQEPDFVDVYRSAVHDEMAWDQLIIDLAALAGIAKLEEDKP